MSKYELELLNAVSLRGSVPVTELAALLQDEETYVYICGLKGMEQGVEDTFTQVCSEHGLELSVIKSAMQQMGRYHVETY